MNKMKNLGFIVIFLVSIVALSGCVDTGTQEFKIAIIFATGGLGDKSFNDAGYRGYLQANETYGDRITVDYVEPEDIPEFATYQNSFATDGTYDLIICIGFLQETALNDSALAFPNQKWVIIDSDIVPRDNVKMITYKEHEGGFLVGAMAAMVTNTSKLGFIGGMDIPLINKFKVGHEQGAKYIDPDINVTNTYMGVPPPQCWTDPVLGKQIGENLYSDGIDIIFVAAGGSGQGVFQAANETTNKMAIGVDSDQDGDMPGKVLASMLKKVETGVYESIKATVEGTWTNERLELGLAEDGVGISPMTHTQWAKNGDYNLNGTVKTRWEWIQDIIAKIIDGTIVVNEPS